MNLEVIEEFLNTHKFPANEVKSGFLEIIGKEHHENTISKLYAHFINCEDIEVRSAFVESLVKIIRKKRADLDFKIYMPIAKTEVKARNNKRIDILLMDRNEHSCIIIENKIYHWLQNNLLDYYYFHKKSKIFPNHKIGILLTLIPYQITQKQLVDKFINITHGEWIAEVQKRLVKRTSLSKNDVYLNDFIKTMEKLTKQKSLDGQAKFYFKNAKRINEALYTQQSANDFIESELRLIASNLDLQLYGSEIEWRNIWDEVNKLDVYFTIDLADLVKGRKMGYRLILELSGNPRKESDSLLEKVNKLKCFKALTQKGCEESTDYQHFAAKDYKINLNELTSLHLHVLANLKKDFYPLTIKVLQHFYPQKSYDAAFQARFERLEI